MEKSTFSVSGKNFPVYRFDTIIVGTGCAGYNAADSLYDYGHRNIAMVTEGVHMGTSRNTGSDKQTYYKLSLAGDGSDSVRQMADDLFAGFGVDGEIARAEAAGSAQSFLKLANLGVPFPTNDYGEFVGYQTDHDTRQRATSAGPLTSRYMTECLQRSVESKKIPVFDQMLALDILLEDNRAVGLLCLDQSKQGQSEAGLTVFRCEQLVMATGGPAGCYSRSVYPESQTGMSGMMLGAGAKGVNLHEWQYGLASVDFRWNLSGTYQQVLPRYFSIDDHGQEREFLSDYYETSQEALDAVFLKGYQWPFDSDKIAGSSLVDLIVYHESVVLERDVFLDFRTNPAGLDVECQGCGQVAFRYLEQSGALLATPFLRLQKMNPDAVRLYLDHGIDLSREPLRIAVCAQHHNGGILVDKHWRSSIPGLYVAGEAAGTFGRYRPGGSALNSTQVGSLRAAEHIAYQSRAAGAVTEQGFLAAAREKTELWLSRFDAMLQPGEGKSAVAGTRDAACQLMSRTAAFIRRPEAMKKLSGEFGKVRSNFFEHQKVTSPWELSVAVRTYDTLLTQEAVLTSMCEAAELFGSEGSALVVEGEPGKCASMKPLGGKIITKKTDGNIRLIFQYLGQEKIIYPEVVKPIPEPNNWFETVWGEYRSRRQGTI